MALLLILAAVPALSEIRSDQALTAVVIGAAPGVQQSGRVVLVYSHGDDDATLMSPRLFLRTLASPDPQMSPGRKRAAR